MLQRTFRLDSFLTSAGEVLNSPLVLLQCVCRHRDSGSCGCWTRGDHKKSS